MVSLSDLKELVMYKKKFFLPIDMKDKKHGSAITLLTPNFNSSKMAMTAPYIVNHRYFESYYVEKEITRFIKNESAIRMEDHGEYIFEEALDTKKRNNLHDEEFGIPSQRKYPLNDEKHVMMAIRFFNHVDQKYEETLASNIIKKIKQYSIEDIVKVGESNRFKIYWDKNKPAITNESTLLLESNVSRKDIIEKVKSDLEKDGLKAHISKNGDWGYTNFVDNKSSTICLGSFSKETYNKAYAIIKNALPSGYRANKDNYFTIFIDSEPTVQEECMYLTEVINPKAIENASKKLTNPSNIFFSGYKNDIITVKKYIGKNSVSKCFARMNRPSPSKVTIIVCNDHNVDPEFKSNESVIVYTPNALSKTGLNLDYKDYIAYVLQLFAVYSLAPNNRVDVILDSVAEAAAIYFSGVADSKLNNKEFKHLSIEKVFKYIENHYSLEELMKIICSNDVNAILRYNKELRASPVDESIVLMKEEYDLIIEEAEEKELNSSISLDDSVPDSIKNIQNMATRLKRNIRRQSVYKLNKIKRDMERGNVGTENREIKSLELLKSGLPDIQQNGPGDNADIEESFSFSKIESMTNGDYIMEGDVMYLFEDGNYDTALRKTLFQDRFRNNKQVLQLYQKIKSELPFIKFTFVDLNRYMGKNLFIDLSYYNESFFRNTMYLNDLDRSNTVRIFNVYAEFLTRLLKDYSIPNYKQKTIFIPILDWNHNNSTRMWMYKEDINPISIIYYMMTHNPSKLKKIFGNKDVVFLGARNYFKVNFSNTDFDNPKNTRKFLNLTKRIINLGYHSPADPDPEGDFDESPKGIAMDIINKVEKSQNVEIRDVSKVDSLSKSANIYSNRLPIDIAPDNKAVRKDVVNLPASKVPAGSRIIPAGKIDSWDYSKSSRGAKITAPVEVEKKVVSAASDKASKGLLSDTKSVNITSEEDKKNAIVDKIVFAASNSDSVDGAIDKLDTEEFKEMIAALQADSVDNVRVSRTQASAVVNAQNEFHKKEIAGRSVQDMLDYEVNTNDIPESDLPVASINDDWHHLTFINFDKDYDFNADIMKMLDSMQYWTFPIAVENVSIRDNSTSEDILDLWTIDCIDYANKKFTIKVDIPKFINGSNFLKLRGNEKTLMIQSALLPIIKTGLDECQIIGSGGYNKIFVERFGDRKGQSMASTSRLIKALVKYCEKYDDIKIEAGDNTKVCTKYELPIDYIDLSRTINSIESKGIKIYFNQDELRSDYEIDDTKGIPVGVVTMYDPSTKKGIESILYFTSNKGSSISTFIANTICMRSPSFNEFYNKIPNVNTKRTYSKARIMNCRIPIILICAYLEGLITTMRKAGIEYEFVQELDKSVRFNDDLDYIGFEDGYLVYKVNYSSSLLMNGLKENDTESYSIKDINNRKMYIDFLGKFASNLDMDGLENSYDCMIDPITKEILQKFKMPDDYVGVLIFASNLLADNKYVKHIDQSGRRWRRKELIAGYFYKALTTAYQQYANANRRTRRSNKLDIKQSAVIDLLVSKDPATSDLSVNNALNDVECANSVTNKGLVGMNVSRGYTIATRGYDDSMLNLLGMDTGFSGNVGINRQATVNANIESGRGFVKTIEGDTDKMSAASSFTMTEAVTPFGSTHDDPPRTLMTYVQTSKHMIRCDSNDPTLVTTGADEAMAYMVSDIFAYKAKKDGKIVELVQEGFGGKNYIVVEYSDGSHEFVNLSEEVKKNSDGGYYVPMKLDTDLKLGDKFKKGEIIAYDKLSFSKSLGESGNLAANIGTLAKVAIINTDEGFEDSSAVTQKFAEKMGTSVIQSVEASISKQCNIYIRKDIGDTVMEGDTLFEYQEDFGDEVSNILMKNLNKMDDLSQLGKKPVNSKYTGIVADIVIYRTCKDDEMSESLTAFVNKYEDRVNNIRSVYDRYGIDSSALPRVGKVPEVGRTKHLDDGVLIVYYIKYNDAVSLGDKITYYSANKGIIKYIIPEGQEPYTDFRPNETIDSFMSLSSVSGRMTCSIPLFAATSKLMVELDRSIKDLAGIPYDVEKL